ncbi:uncharacterized protein LOC101460229 [Ceratitis capitata]|uniref:uncharacterized protein LOC101460229 n=1 Tax=Ceratitis capitata TaxID=7213 RepID=UPI000329AE68|nr:uncharacterized protein LOC101460229 [Ceratitis capitata]
MSYYPLIVLTLYYFNGNKAMRHLPAPDVQLSDGPLHNTVLRVYKEAPFETIFLLGKANGSSFNMRESTKNLEIPLIAATDNATGEKLKTHFNSKLLAIVCLSHTQLELTLLNVLAEYLQHRRQTRIILYFAEAAPSATVLAVLSAYLVDHYMTNVIGLYGAVNKSVTSTHYLSYQPFHHSHWRLKLLNTTSWYFPTKQQDFEGKTFLTLPGQNMPRCIIIVDSSGVQRLSGYVGYLVNTFAEKYNVSFRFLYPVSPGEFIHLTTLLELVANGTLDLAITLVPASFKMTNSYHLLTYPLEVNSWFVMLPCPQPLQYAEIYKIVVTKQVINVLVLLMFLFSLLDTVMNCVCRRSYADYDLLNILVNENIIRGVFGLSFFIRPHSKLSLKILYTFLLMLGFFVTNMYSAYFQTLFTSPPLQHDILTFNDMRRRNLKLMFDRHELRLVQELFGPDYNTTIKPVLQIEDTAVFQRHRRAYDTSYAYTMPESLWSIFSAQQQTFERKLYCLAPTLRLYSMLGLSLALAENSYLMAPLNKLILRVIETGLLEHWRTMTFIDLLASKQLSLKETNQRERFHEIRIEDMQLPFYALLCGLALGSVAFASEIYLFKIKNSYRQRMNRAEAGILFL